MPRSKSGNLIRSMQSPALGGVEVLYAAYHDFEHPKHFHETYVFGVIEAGWGTCWMAGTWFEIQTGQVVCVEPGEVHTGEKHGEEMEVYRALYPSHALMSEFFGDVFLPVSSGVYDAPNAARAIASVHRAIQAGEDLRLSELRLGHVLQELAAPTQSGEAAAKPAEGLKTILEAIHDDPDEGGGLRSLAQMAEMSPFQLMGAFRKSLGITPHQYVLSLRVARARKLLLQGMKAGEVAAEVGFADQAHLTRAFRKFVGTPPAAFAGRS